MSKDDENFGSRGVLCALKESVYAIQRASGASGFGWELMMDATHIAGVFGERKDAYCIVNFASSRASIAIALPTR